MSCSTSVLDDAGLGRLPTPALVIDGAVVERNIERLADYCRRWQVRLRPHAKTHKSCRVASLQLAAGAAGLTVAKVSEAETLADLTDDLLLAYPPVDAARADRLAMLARERTVHAAVDSPHAVELAAAAARRTGVTVGLLVDLDVGLGRTGVQSPEETLTLAQQIDGTPGVRLDGLFFYPGHVWNAADDQAEPMRAVGALVEESLRHWSRSGLAARIVSGGSTPTAYQSHLLPAITEIRPGTYVYNDMNTVRGGFCTLDDCAARLVATVVSNAVPGQAVLDSGSKALTSDRCVPAPESGHGYVVEYPAATITRLSEEHAQVDVRACDRAPEVGERVTIIPNHICPCINLQSSAWWRVPGAPPEPIAIESRGKLI